MVKVFLDTNFFLRFILEDHDQSKQCIELVEAIDRSVCTPYTSSIVFLELNYVLTSPRIYQFSKKKSLRMITQLQKMRNLVLIEDMNFDRALEIYAKTNIKLGDCVIASQVPEDVLFCSFDKDFLKIKNMQVYTPSQILELFVNE